MNGSSTLAAFLVITASVLLSGCATPLPGASDAGEFAPDAREGESAGGGAAIALDAACAPIAPPSACEELALRAHAGAVVVLEYAASCDDARLVGRPWCEEYAAIVDETPAVWCCLAP